MFDERFARQYRYGPPSAFRQTSTSSGKVHHLSGPDSDARLKPFTEDQGRLAGHALHFHCAHWLATKVLAHTSDSLVRVSRRVGCRRAHQLETLAAENCRRRRSQTHSRIDRKELELTQETEVHQAVKSDTALRSAKRHQLG